MIILLNGPSSSGKSTLAKELKKSIYDVFGYDYEIVSIDDFLNMSPDRTIYEEDVYEISKQLCDKAVAIYNKGMGVIIDHVITSQRIYNNMMESFNQFKVMKICVTCPVEELRRREKERGDRCAGSAEASMEYLYPKKDYDLTVDTYALSCEENARIICDFIKNKNF